jgi:hypothetical protein
MDITILSAKQAAPLAGVAFQTLGYHLTQKHLPAVKIGNTWAIRSDDLNKFIQDRARGLYIKAEKGDRLINRGRPGRHVEKRQEGVQP